MTKRQVWITDNSNPKYQKIKSIFLDVMSEHAKQQKINYYDFLLVAKKLSFRFEESSHLMALKNYFAKNKNSVIIKKISQLLCISQQSIHALQEKIIVKFNVPDTQFAPIKEETHEDQEYQEDEVNLQQDFQKIGGDLFNEENNQINQKMAIILSIKVEQMDKKIKALINQKQDNNLIQIATHFGIQECNYEEFKKIMLSVLGHIKQRVKISEDDIKTIFYILDTQQKGVIYIQNIAELKNIPQIINRLRQFYRSRINRDMVKNTLFKLGKVRNNSIQIYQVKNASLLEFQNMEKAIIEENQHRVGLMKIKTNKIPHFGPLKGAAMANKQRQTAPGNMGSIKAFQSQIRVERQRIQKILRVSKDRRKEKKGDTVASKLRSLFIHKVILPREKMLEQQKQRYMKRGGTQSTDLFIKSSK